MSAARSPEPYRFLVARGDLRHTRCTSDPDAPGARALAAGEVRLRVEQFALTANNVTYAAFGQEMDYWRFFPSGDEAFGCIPVWGFATVVESRCEGVESGMRVYGYLPMGSYLVVQPARVRPRGFVDAAPHRAGLAAAYNDYAACAQDPLYDAQREGLQALLRPLFTTSFLLDDFLAGQGDFGARRLVLSSASSKTAYGTAFCIGRRAGHPQRVGLTSRGNFDFVRSLGCYEQVLAYDELPSLDANVPASYVDFAGSAPLRLAVHRHLGDALRYSCAVGGSHWQDLRSPAAERLPGPAPQLFFAPAQAQRRAAPPPEGLGPRGLEQAIAGAWHAFIETLSTASPPWLVVRHGRGPQAMADALSALVGGAADPREGLMLSPD
ncbi:DUF2855 family protein [Ideonella sp.]|uniref:DUF2855 family protein n=1 Tax=Ideonella sp. TaxID=1929293 RepID=UPI002B474C85|nr:DUF2855 family protein [Ideonella sp.]HJV69614.1 DUF2855 family protein [Ideonella sp.]